MSCTICENLTDADTFDKMEENPSEEMLEHLKDHGTCYMLGLASESKEPCICFFYLDENNKVKKASRAADAYYCLICGEKLR